MGAVRMSDSNGHISWSKRTNNDAFYIISIHNFVFMRNLFPAWPHLFDDNSRASQPPTQRLATSPGQFEFEFNLCPAGPSFMQRIKWPHNKIKDLAENEQDEQNAGPPVMWSHCTILVV